MSANQTQRKCLLHGIEEEDYREKAARLQAILDTTVDGIVTINEQGTVQSFNKAAEKIFGYSADEIIGRNVSMLMPSPFQEEHNSYIENYLRTGSPKVIGKGREVLGIKKDGVAFPLYLAVSEVWVRKERRLFTGILRDITDRKRTEENLRRAKDELEKRVSERTAQLLASKERLEAINRDLEEFLFAASNDLQEPLRKIQLLNDRLKAAYCEFFDEAGKTHLEKIQNEALRMQELIQALIGYSRLESHAGPFILVDLRSVVNDVIRDFENFIKKTEIYFDIGDMPAIEADPVQIYGLLHHLVGNALKFRRAQTPVVRIQAAILKEGGTAPATSPGPDEFCRITVEDNGIGFDEKYLDRIFMPFKRLHSRSSQYRGTGMGLAICRKIVEIHGGTITARSTPGKGSVFTVILPRSRSNGRALI